MFYSDPTTMSQLAAERRARFLEESRRSRLRRDARRLFTRFPMPGRTRDDA